MPIPLGQTLRLWRLHRGMTQQQLAETARIPRPNLSVVEQGKREVSLLTLRALALALDVRPGALLDGVLPTPPGEASHLSREALERIAEAVSRGTPLNDPTEEALTRLFRSVTTQRARLAGRQTGGRRLRVRTPDAAWLTLETLCSRRVLRTLLERIEERQRQHESTAN